MLAPANSKSNLQFFSNCKYYQNVAPLTCAPGLRCSCWVSYGWDLSCYEGQCRGKASFILTLVTEAVRCEVVSTDKQTYTNHSWHIVETQLLSLLLFHIGTYVDFYNEQQGNLRV